MTTPNANPSILSNLDATTGAPAADAPAPRIAYRAAALSNTHRLATVPDAGALVSYTTPDAISHDGRTFTGDLAAAVSLALSAVHAMNGKKTDPAPAVPVSTFDAEIIAGGRVSGRSYNPTAQRRAERLGAHAETRLLAAGFSGNLDGNWGSGLNVTRRARSILAAAAALHDAPPAAPSVPADAPADAPTPAADLSADALAAHAGDPDAPPADLLTADAPAPVLPLPPRKKKNGKKTV